MFKKTKNKNKTGVHNTYMSMGNWQFVFNSLLYFADIATIKMPILRTGVSATRRIFVGTPVKRPKTSA